ncbi:DNA-directed RNA polymerase subunit beta [Conexibacter stalactiti]|uniref:DNA-directed RNA polymerase subunit beta n=1 Tax=Conexibacter stalactiti TaxID=1940611 RepID=A0ABU4HWX2_9ACTN|nr:DNA-directed RNA polymerase subunit beta [Conexibacter stalactiti]MDW5596569.1 DNA-directed RNA polymerase subunit beta [Conexibacter stalactiti]MEC5037211.1 DNA-directed RNA polymerase subunit beta [Conexibacter stalactiti]
MAPVAAPRTRRTFARLSKALEVPNLIDIQKRSFAWLTDAETGGLRETIDDISPIEDYTGNLAVQFGEFTFDEPVASLDECREKDLTYARPLTVTVAFVNRETGEIREQSVFMGDFPWMTERGTFIINGTERVVVTQLVRSPGAYLMEAKDREKQVFIANLMPARGSWLELEIDKKGKVYVRIDRKRKLPVTVLLRAMGYSSDEEIASLFEDSLYIRNTIESDTEVTKTEEGALIELFKKQRPGEPPSVDAARALLHQLFFDPKRYDLTRVGRYKLNSRLRLDIDLETRTLTHDDIIALIKELVSLPRILGMPEQPEVEIRDYAAEAVTYPREAVADHLDEYEHFGNRRLRTVGELIQEAFRIGLYRMERVVRERLTTEDADTITPQTIVNIRPVVAALKEFFGSSQLSQFMDQNNSLSGLTHRRRLSALGAGGLTRERAPIEVRDVHPTHYGRMCPIETPEGPNIGLIGSLSSYAQISEHGFVTTPYLVVKDGKVTEEIVHLDATQEEEAKIAQANTPLAEDGTLIGTDIVCRTQAGSYVRAEPGEVDLMDVSPEQIWSVATAMIPFLEHDDANRALMGSNMQRQAVPLLKTDAPLVGTGMEYRAAVDSGDVVVAKRAGTITYIDADQIVIETEDGAKDEYVLQKFMRSNQGTLIHHKPIVKNGDQVVEGTVLADGSSTDSGEMALGKNLRVAFMSWEGYNFEDAIILSKRLVKDDELTSIHIEEYEIDARTTKLGDEEITRDIPNRSEESLRNLDDRGIVRIGAEVGSGDLLVGKVTPKGETELTAEEKLIRAIFKEKAREVRDTSLKVPHGEGGVVIDVKTFSRDAGDDLPPGVNDLVRVFVAKKRKISEGDKLAGRHGNKGVISKIVDEQDMPFLEDGSPVDVILNPLGVPSRMNIGQILETHLGWAAAEGWYDDGSDAYKIAHGRGDERPRVYVSTPVFDGATVADVDNALLQWQNEHTGRIRMKTAPDDREGTRASGKFTLFNGRTGEPFETQVTVGYMYILKLHHLVDDKIHARSTGPYSLVTQQPLGGKAQFGGQRFGEMEVWALEAYGAAYTLQEMLTIKSDDTVGRVKAYEAIVKGENIAEPSIPESFKVLLKEMQSLALDVNVVSEEGTRAEMREEDDDLLRAAEELGIDLSGVRATDGQAADEGTESEDDTDAGAPEATAEEAPGDEPLAAVADEDLSEDDA